MHGDQEVTINAASLAPHKNAQTSPQKSANSMEDGLTEERARIVGLDEYGYLRVKTVAGLEFSVHDDGNSFDMMQGLIKPKRAL